MKRTRHNLRGVSCLLTLALILTASVSRASWQCLDGTACSLHHPILLRVAAPTHLHPTGIQATCHHCLSGNRTVPTHTGMRACGTSPHCVLRESASPAAALPTTHAAPLLLVALLPGKLAFAEPLAAQAVVAFVPRYAIPPPFLWPHLGRAPPVLL